MTHSTDEPREPPAPAGTEADVEARPAHLRVVDLDVDPGVDPGVDLGVDPGVDLGVDPAADPPVPRPQDGARDSGYVPL